MSSTSNSSGGNNLNQNFALIALLRTLHERGDDSWSAFADLSLAILEDQQNLNTFLGKFYSVYSAQLPREVAYTVLARLRKNGSVTYQRREGPYSLTEEGSRKAIALQNSSKSFNEEFKSLVADLNSYLKSKSIKLPNPDKELIKFIDANLAFTGEILVGVSNYSGKSAVEIANYILSLESRNKALFSVIQNIFFGRLYLQIFRLQAQRPIDQKARFDRLRIIIDTNIIFSAIGLHGDEERKATNNLISILGKIDNVDVVVLDVSIDEAKRTIIRSIADKDYVKKIKVNDLGWRLRNLGYDELNIVILTEGLEAKLEKSGVICQRVTSVPSEENVSKARAISEKFGQDKGPNTIDHDATIITQVDEDRSGMHSSLLEKSKSVFLSTDRGLLVNAKEEAEGNNIFPSIISPIELISLVWLKNIAKEDLMRATFRQALMAYAREKMLESGRWQEFTDFLREAKEKGMVDDEEITLIVDNEQTKSLLFQKNKEPFEKIINKKYLASLKREREKLRSEADGRRKDRRTQEYKQRKISRFLAKFIIVPIYMVGAAIIFLVSLILLKIFNLNGLANLVSVVVPVSLIIVVFFSGKVPKLDHVAAWKQRLNRYIENKVKSILQRIFY